MEISYAILACNEHNELDHLLSILYKKVRPEDEVVVLLDTDNFTSWMYQLNVVEENAVDSYLAASDKADEALYNAYLDFDGTEEEFANMLAKIVRIETGIWSAIIAMFIGS